MTHLTIDTPPGADMRWTQLRTLLLREWLQQRTGWLAMMALPTLVLLAAALFSHINVDFHNDAGEVELHATSVALATTAGILGAMLALGLGMALLMSLLQAGGLARRDMQDRSVEFWRSLPVSDSLSVAVPLVAHLLLLPLACMLVDLVGGLLVSLVAVARTDGLMAWLGLPWGVLLGAAVALALRLALGLVLALLWLSPLVLLVMAASAWLKRWGMPLVAAVLGLGGLLLDKVYGWPIVNQTVGYLLREAGYALVPLVGRLRRPSSNDLDQILHQLPGLLLADAGAALRALAQPGLLAVLAASAGCFALLVWRRRRAG